MPTISGLSAKALWPSGSLSRDGTRVDDRNAQFFKHRGIWFEICSTDTVYAAREPARHLQRLIVCRCQDRKMRPLWPHFDELTAKHSISMSGDARMTFLTLAGIDFSRMATPRSASAASQVLHRMSEDGHVFDIGTLCGLKDQSSKARRE